MLTRYIFLFILVLASVTNAKAQNIGQQPGVEYRKGGFFLPSKIYGNKSVSVNYEVPFDLKTKQPLKTASTILFMAPYINDLGLPWDKLSWTPFARKMGWSSFSLVIKTDPNDVRVPQKCYYYPVESGSGELVIAAYQKIQAEFKLGGKKLLIGGQSGGAQFAHRFAMAYPEHVDAIAIQGSGWFSESDPKGTNVPVCLTTTVSDEGRTRETLEFADAAREAGYTILCAVTPPPDKITIPEMKHDPGPLSYELMDAYLAGIDKIRTRDGANRSWTQFGYMGRKSQPGWIVPLNKEQAANIPGDDLLLFPDEETVKVWQKVLGTGLKQE